MRVIVAGATGFIGRALVATLRERGDRVVALTRNPTKARQELGAQVEVLQWHPPDTGPWMEAFAGADGVVNLSGEQIVAPLEPWTHAKKERILASRVDPTKTIVRAIEAADPRPAVLINQSATGYYGSQGETVLTEHSPAGSDFLANVVRQWEDAARPVEQWGVRLVLLRTSPVLGRGGGILPQFALPFRLYLGGTMGYPDQWLSWIHMDDEIGLIVYALTHDTVRGVINATAPNPVTMEIFSRQLGEALHRPSWVPLLGPALKLALGQRAEAVLTSQRVLPKAAEAAGYRFQYSQSDVALRDLLAAS